MKLISKAMVLLSFALLSSGAGATGAVVCPKWVCGSNSPVVAGAQAPFPGWGHNLNSPVVAGAQIDAHGAFPAGTCAATAARPR